MAARDTLYLYQQLQISGAISLSSAQSPESTTKVLVRNTLWAGKRGLLYGSETLMDANSVINLIRLVSRNSV